jgi:hypothetical protein
MNRGTKKNTTTLFNKSILPYYCLFIVFLPGCMEKKDPSMATTPITPGKPIHEELVCKLTSAELQQRRATVIAKLKSQVLTSQELENGYATSFTEPMS